MRPNGIILMAGVAGIAACVGPFSEDLESHYADARAARKDGAFSRGWLPDIVPEDAVDISEIHNLDTNLTWACFTTPGGPSRVRELLAERGAHRSTGPIDDGPGGLLDRREWWPNSMSDSEVEAYRLEESDRFTVLVGVDASVNRVCLHRS